MTGAARGALALFVVAFLLTLLITSPASLLDYYLQNATSGRLVLANASGTIWRGSAIPALRPQTGYALALQPLRWEVALLPLLGGEIAVRLHWDVSPATPPMSAIVSFGRTELQQARLTLPARVIEEASPVMKTARLHGQLQIQSERMAFSKHGIEGGATVDWLQAGSAFSSVDPLGDYRLTLNGAGDQVRIGLATISGKLLLEGQGSWSVARGLEFHGKAQASPTNREPLAELLRNLGPEEAPGVHRFDLTPRQ